MAVLYRTILSLFARSNQLSQYLTRMEYFEYHRIKMEVSHEVDKTICHRNYNTGFSNANKALNGPMDEWTIQVQGITLKCVLSFNIPMFDILDVRSVSLCSSRTTISVLWSTWFMLAISHVPIVDVELWFRSSFRYIKKPIFYFFFCFVWFCLSCIVLEISDLWPFSLSAVDFLSVNFVFKPLHSLLKTNTDLAKNGIAGSFISSNDTMV